MGAAGFTVARHFITLGVKPENLIPLDIDGVVHKNRADLVADADSYLHGIALERDERTLWDAIPDADVFVGLSAPNLLKPEMLLQMQDRPLLFCLANPTPV